MRVRGYTMVEVVVVAAIAAVLASTAVPSFHWLTARQRISDSGATLAAHLEYARMEATARGRVVSVCRASTDRQPLQCSSAAGEHHDGNDWAAGWIVFEKSGGADEGRVEPGDQLLLTQTADRGARRLTLRANVPSAQRIAFPPRGTGGVVGAGTFAIDYGTPPAPVASRPLGSIALSAAARCIAVAPVTGALRTYRAAAGSCR